MKILHVIESLDPQDGGPVIACLGMASMMARRGHGVRIVTTDRGFDRATIATTAPHVSIDTVPLMPPAALRLSGCLYRRLARAIPEADVVHLHSLYLFHDWAAGRLCRRVGTPYIVEPHGTLDPFIWRRRRRRKSVLEALFQNAALQNAAGLHYTTEEEARLAQPYARNERGVIASLGLDLAAFDRLPPRSALRERYPSIGHRKVVLFLGRLHEKKGVDIATEAFARVTRDRDDLFLVIAGPDDGMRQQIEQRCRALGIEPRVLFTGMVQDEAKRVVYAGSDVFLLPSMSENFAITVIEAAASGVPVIMSDRVNLWREFAAAHAALVAPPTADDFAERLRRTLDRPAETEARCRAAAELVRLNYSWDSLAPIYESMYATAINGGALPRLLASAS